VQAFLEFFGKSACQGSSFIGIGMGPVVKIQFVKGVVGFVTVDEFLLHMYNVAIFIQVGRHRSIMLCGKGTANRAKGQ